MKDSASYLRRLALLGGGLLIYWLLMLSLSRGWQGALLMAHGLAATAVGITIGILRWRDELGRRPILTVALIFVAWGLGDFGWAVRYFVHNESNRSPLVVLTTESAFILAFALSLIAILSAIEDRLSAFFKRWVVRIPLLLTSPIAFRLILAPFLSHRDSGLTAFNLGEIAAISISYLALNLALLALLSSRSLEWSIFAAGIMCLVFGDWSIRVDKLIGQAAEFNLGSFFILFGLYAAALPFLRKGRIGRIQRFDSSSILNGYRLGLLVVALSLVLVFALYQSDGIRSLRILCLGSGAVAFVAVFLSQMMVERVQWFSAQLGRVLRSEIEQSAGHVSSPDIELPIELREIYDRAFSNTLREQKLREEQRSLEQRRQLQTQVAHDIRSPLYALNIAVSALPKSMSEENQRLLRSAASRIGDIANDLLQDHRQAQDESLPEPTSLPAQLLILSLVEEVVDEKRPQLPATKALELASQSLHDHAGLTVIARSRELKRALSNLIDNAAEALDGPGVITVRVSAEGPWGLITIADTGRGISAEVLSRLGERGFTHGKPGGSGLGLHHARSAIESDGGTLTIRSIPGTGTTVEIRLPASPSASVRPAPNVLVIDDEPTVGWAWRKQQKHLGLAQVCIFPSMEACESAGIEYPTFAIAFVDLRIKGTSWPVDKTIRHLKERGIARVYIATGSSNAHKDPLCSGADGITTEKVPSDLDRYLPPA